jgi:hypothetical protein
VKSSKDIQIHAAVTIMPNANNLPILDPDPEKRKDQEIAQFAVQLDARFAPFTHHEVKTAFDGLFYHCLRKMRAAGLLKAGS